MAKAKLGGTRAVLFVYAMVGLENMAFFSNAVSLVTYFYGYMNFGLTKSATTLTNFLGTAFLLAIFGAFISDTFLSRIQTCIFFGCIEVVGYALLTVQAHFQSLRPAACKGFPNTSCHKASGIQAMILYTGLYLVSFGTSGVKGALPVLGADQFDEKNPEELIKLSSFFNWFVFSITVGGSIGVTLLVWINTDIGWDWFFGLCTISVFLAVVFIAMGRSFFRNDVAGGIAITSVLQVLVAASRNWRLPAPSITDNLHNTSFNDDESPTPPPPETLSRTDQFRFLDRAAIPLPTPFSSDPWRLCTITQVEEVKILLRMFPIILSTVCMNICLAQLQTFSIQQATTLDNRITANFRIPVSSLSFIPLALMSLLIPLYDRAFVPLARRLTSIPTGIRHLQRVGVGLILSAVSMIVAGFVEQRRKAVRPERMSVFWLGIQYGVFGLADMFTLVGLLEFFYEESGRRMRSLSTAVSWVALAMGYFGSTAVVEVVNGVSGGWLDSDDLDRDKLEYFYWLLGGVSVVNFGVYLVCASWYRCKKLEEKGEDWQEGFGKLDL